MCVHTSPAAQIVHPKSDEQRRRLEQAVKGIFLFRPLDQVSVRLGRAPIPTCINWGGMCREPDQCLVVACRWQAVASVVRMQGGVSAAVGEESEELWGGVGWG